MRRSRCCRAQLRVSKIGIHFRLRHLSSVKRPRFPPGAKSRLERQGASQRPAITQKTASIHMQPFPMRDLIRKQLHSSIAWLAGRVPRGTILRYGIARTSRRRSRDSNDQQGKRKRDSRTTATERSAPAPPTRPGPNQPGPRKSLVKCLSPKILSNYLKTKAKFPNRFCRQFPPFRHN